MKRNILFTVFFLFLFYSTTFSQQVLKTTTETVKLRIGGLEYVEDLPLSVHPVDTFELTLYSNPLSFGIYSDLDSLTTVLAVGETFDFTVLMEGMAPFAIQVINGLEPDPLSFDNTTDNSIHFAYSSSADNPYLRKLLDEYPVLDIGSSPGNDLEKVKQITSWVNNLWDHDGDHAAEQLDALYILDQVKKGERFRCVEYGVVTAACLNAIGLPARLLYLKTEEAETAPYAAGHAVAEVYLKDLDKWVMVDPQMDAIVLLNEIPLNAIEIQQALTEKKNVSVHTGDVNTYAEVYLNWLYPYLYYFHVYFDNRDGISSAERMTVEGKNSLMLVPKGAKNPTVFQQSTPIDYCVYTHSVADFYRKP